MTDPLDLLRRLQVSLVSGWMPPDVARWLAGGVEKYLNGQPLDAALELKSAPGKPNPAAQIRLAERDELVRRAARGLEGSTWEQAAMLERVVSGEDANSMQKKYLDEADRLELDIPKSQAQLYRILNGRRD